MNMMMNNVISTDYVDVSKDTYSQTKEQFENLCKIFVHPAGFYEDSENRYVCFDDTLGEAIPLVAWVYNNTWVIYYNGNPMSPTNDFEKVFNFLLKFNEKSKEENYVKGVKYEYKMSIKNLD